MKNIVMAVALSASIGFGGLALADKGSGAGSAAAPAQKSLYDRLGGKKAVAAVVDDFVTNVSKDKVINKRFAKTDIKKLKKNLNDQICAATGGGCKYEGKDMKTAHKGMKITEDEWKATVGDLVAALDKNKVPDKEKNELLTPLAGMHDDIVGQ